MTTVGTRTLADPELHLGGVTVDGAPAARVAVVCGLLAAMAAFIRLLAALDTALIRGMLR